MIHFNYDSNKMTDVIILGVPDHLNQIGKITYQNSDLTQTIENDRHRHIVSSQLGKTSSTILYINNEPKRLITVGLGNLKTLSYASFLKVFGTLFQYLKKERVTEANVLFETFNSKQIDKTSIAEIFGLQSRQSIYEFNNYKSNKSTPYQLELYIESSNSDEDIKNIKAGYLIGESVNIARDFSNMPPNILTPEYFANKVAHHFKSSSVSVDIKNNDTLLSEGFGLLHAVGKGSTHPPVVITLTYHGTDKNEAPIALVGKGITYDSGGYSIKSKMGMQTMKFDMCGAANVVGMIDAASKLSLPVNIVGVIVSAENMISQQAMKPDDVYTALNGETVEVLNSDAEGRLVLGDDVFYANQFQPRLICDFATLTGAAIAALGEDKAALFSSNADEDMKHILESAREVDEFAFELPITQTEQQLIRNTDVADLVNHTNGQGKALFAAAFVTHFSGQTPHIHFDIAGPATINKDNYKGPKGPTGSMIMTIVNWLRQSK
ncbi:leucyl aminopeptidase family protein [Staphylococcus hominis]|uniref:M17 family metallopeptidase n=1 Tax=Staphylococcus hominis TaxID=1290 RepID=UPI0028741B1D|nr:leucyl aminopeptidase family protein [Staphylococcus hominis]MDS0981938.1 leucyl aminopeptidase family protein [Staphylococcus hominis]